MLSSSVSAALLPACSRSKQGGHCAENDTCGTPPINATSAAGGGNIALAVFTPTLKTDERLAPAKRRSGDEVTSLPGWDGPLPSRQFSGMIDAKSWGGQVHQQHYWLVESERDPKNDPLVVWYQGGPGASSMFGYLVELGPFWLTGESLAQRTADGTPRLIRNNFSWSTVANVLFVDFPAPVGFSQCGSNASCTDLGCCNWANGSHKSSDFTGAEDNYIFLQNFFEEFPEFYDHELFIVGESYAGTYVPLLVEHVLAGNDAAEMAGSGGARPLPLVGMAIGNGVVGSDVGNLAPFFNFLWFHGHGQFSERTYHETVEACCGAPACTVEKWFNSSSAACHASRWTHEVAGFYQYNLYDTCNHTGGFRGALAAEGQQQPEAEREAYRRGRGGGLPPQLRGAGPAEGGAHPLPLRNLAYPCGGEQAMQVYMGLPQVKAALHVPPDAVFYDSDGMGAQYTYGSRDQRPWYRKVVGEGRLRILVYSGDADTCVNTLWSEWWTTGLGISEVESWRGWTMDNETAMAGYVTRYAHDFDFLTIRGAGHM